MNRSKITAALTLCMLSSTLAAQQNPDLSTIRVSTNFVLLDALVEYTKSTTLIEDLHPTDFQILEDGTPQTITYFSHDQLPLSVIFLFDLTQTVQPTLKPLAEGAREILTHLKPQDEVAIMVFSSHTKLLQDFTTDRALTAAAIDQAADMSTKEGTFIHEDMYEALDQAQRSTVPDSRRVLVWLTDGTANFENSLTQKTMGKESPARLHTREESTARLLESGVAVAALIDRSVDTGAFVTVADLSPFSFLVGGRIGDINKYADETGGPVLKTSKQSVAVQLSKLIDQLRGRYTLGYKPAAPRPPGSFCKLQVGLTPAYRARTQTKKPEALVRAKRGYYR